MRDESPVIICNYLFTSSPVTSYCAAIAYRLSVWSPHFSLKLLEIWKQTMSTLTICFSFWIAAFKGRMQYRANFIIGILMGIVFQCTGFVFIWVVLSRFQSVGGWSLGEIAFLYGLRLVMHALNGFFSGALFNLQWELRQGDFDRYLVRPMAPLLQMISQHPPSSALGDLIGGIMLFVAATTLVTVGWTASTIGFLILAIIGGALIEFALRLLSASLSFRFMASEPALHLVDTIFSEFGNYPLAIFGNVLQFLLTYALPLAFMVYFPAAILLNRGNELQIHPAFAYASPLVGLIWFGLGVLVFQHEMRHYKSAGH